MLFRAAKVWHVLALGRTSRRPSSSEHQRLKAIGHHFRTCTVWKWNLLALAFAATHTTGMILGYPGDISLGAQPCSISRRVLPLLLLPSPYLGVTVVLLIKLRKERRDELGLLQELKFYIVCYASILPLFVIMIVYELDPSTVGTVEAVILPDCFYVSALSLFKAVLVVWPLRIAALQRKNTTFLGGAYALGHRVAALEMARAAMRRGDAAAVGIAEAPLPCEESAPEGTLDQQSLRSILSCAASRAHLHRFLERRYCVETLLFWEAVTRLRQRHVAKATGGRGGDDLRQECHRIFATFIHPHGDFTVNLSSGHTIALTQRDEQGQWAADMFDAALESVVAMVEADSFPQFQQSQEFQCMLRELPHAFVQQP